MNSIVPTNALVQLTWLVTILALAAWTTGDVATADTPPLGPMRAEHNSVSFTYDAFLAAGVTAETVVERAHDNDWASEPQHVSLTLEGYAATNDLPLTPQILVYPAASYSGMSSWAAGTMATLRSVLNERQDLRQPYGAYLPVQGSSRGGDPARPWESSPPLLPWSGAATVINARTSYFHTEGVVGVRFLVQEAHNHCWSGSRDVTFYAFQGFTADGAWYIAARFLVRVSFPIAPFTPPDPWSESAYAASCDAANASLAAALEGASPCCLLPSIDALGALVASIRVAG